MAERRKKINRKNNSVIKLPKEQVAIELQKFVNSDFGSASTDSKFNNVVASIKLSVENVLENSTGFANQMIVLKYNKLITVTGNYDKLEFKREHDFNADNEIKAYVKKLLNDFNKEKGTKIKLTIKSARDSQIQLLNRLDGIRQYYYYIRIYHFDIIQ